MQETQACIKKAGLPSSILSGVSDTALARNVAFSTALIAMEKENYEMFVFVDDDMVFDRETVESLIEYATELDHPTSALYVMQSGRPALSCQHSDPDWKKCLWYTGLGMMAVPAHSLLKLAAGSEKLATDMGQIHAFTWSSPHEGKWSSEDYTFCRRLGGVRLAPLRVGHIKPTTLWPDQKLIDDLIEGI